MNISRTPVGKLEGHLAMEDDEDDDSDEGEIIDRNDDAFIQFPPLRARGMEDDAMGARWPAPGR